MMINKNVCAICGSDIFDILGKACHPDVSQIGGTPVILEEKNYEIRECRICHFRWKSPQLTYSDYFNYSSQASADVWKLDKIAIKRRRLKEKQQLIEGIVPGRRVLDIGCGRGDFLVLWGEKWEKYGIEPSYAGRRAAIQQNIYANWEDIKDIQKSNALFDVVCLFDVLEHLTEPYEQLEKVVAKITKGGVLVIETGDTASLISKIMGIDWYYYSGLDHLSFFCEPTIKLLYTNLGLEIKVINNWSHINRGKWYAFKQWYHALGFKWPIIRPRYSFRSIFHTKQLPKKEGFPPWLMGVNDHFFIIGLKP